MLWEMVRSQLGRYKLRTALTIASIFIGIFLLATMVSFSEGVQVTLDTYVGSFAGLVTVVGGDVSSMNDMQAYMSSELDDSMLDEIRAMPEVETAEGMIYIITDAGQVGGFNPNAISMMGMDVGFQDGGFFDEDSDREIVVGSTYAKNGGYAVGDEVEIKKKRYEIVGVLEALGSAQDDSSIWMPLKEAQKVAGKEGKVMVIMVLAANIDGTENLANKIMDQFSDVTAITDKEMIRQMNTMLGQINVMIYTIGLIASIVAGIVIMNVMFMSVNERTTEIGAMKALGATNRQVLTEILFEAVTMSITGGVLGVAFSFLTSVILNKVFATMISAVTLRLVVMALLYSAFLGALGGYWPAKRAVKIDPIEALRYE